MLDIINTIFNYWSWVDEQQVMYTNKKIKDTDPFYTFIYITFAYDGSKSKTKKKYHISRLDKLPIKNLNMQINIETFTTQEVDEYFNKLPDDECIAIENIDINNVVEFINSHGYGICDIICEIHYLQNRRGQIYLKPIMFQEEIMTSIAVMADSIQKVNKDYKAKSYIYIPGEEK